ncbi:MAG: amidohydrolase family protein [Desulfomonilaceae bacterium]
MMIDCHTHLLLRTAQQDRSVFFESEVAFRSLYSSPKARISTTADILRYLDESGIDRAIVFGFPWENYETSKRNNDEIWDFHVRYPDRIIPFATFSITERDLAYLECQRTLNGGFSGLGEISMYEIGWSLSDFENLKPCLNAARLKGVPVMLHVNEPVGHNYPGKVSMDIRALFKTIKAFPDLDIILAHFGGGFFIYSLMPEIGATMKRVYVDTAAAPFIYDSRIFTTALRCLGEDNVLLGTDYPLLGTKRYLKLMDEAGIQGTVKDKILGNNVLKILERKSESNPL